MTPAFTRQVETIARHYGVDAGLVLAVVKAEGGTPETILKAVQCSLPDTRTAEEAIGILCRSLAHRLSDFVKAKQGNEFVEYFASFWAPNGVANDPTHLNANWPRNVKAFWLGREPANRIDVGADVPGGGAA